ncbi:MAG: hypothetical protein ABH828_01830 [archaeon]
MKKKQPNHDSNRVKIMFIVGVVAILAIVAANSNHNIGGEAVLAPVCEVEEYCTEWAWNSNTDETCLEQGFVTYKECSAYSWPLDEKGNPVMKCDSWDTIYKNECKEWEVGTDWEKECVEWGKSSNC